MSLDVDGRHAEKGKTEHSTAGNSEHNNFILDKNQ